MFFTKKIGIPAVALAFFAACANPISPTGGPKDTQPPRIVEEESTPNEQVNFDAREIVITFDEWIQLDNAYGQLVVSPPLQFQPEIKAIGKRLILRFHEDEVLLDSVTYSINFGAAVADHNERNKISDLRFVFATGPELDSLTYTGLVIDAFTGKPTTELAALLFEPGHDSIIAKKKPYYYSSPDESGRFSFENLRAGSYRLVVLRDANNNLRYDLPSEQIAFADGLVTVPDTSGRTLTLRMSQPHGYTPVVSSKWHDSIHFVVAYTDPPPIPPVPAIDDRYNVHYMLDKDSLHIWFDAADLHPDTLIIPQGNAGIDTLLLSVKKPPSRRSPRPLRTSAGTGKIPPQVPFQLTWNQPIRALDTSRIQLIDTADLPVAYSAGIDSADKRVVKIAGAFREDQVYRLTLLPGSLVLWDSTLSSDTMQYNIPVGKRADFGDLRVQLDSLIGGEQYVVEIFRDEKNPIYKGTFVQTGSPLLIQLDGLSPGTYHIQIAWDRNKNGRWDPGDYWKNTQPEPVHRLTLGDLRANWELKLEVDAHPKIQ